MSFANTFIASYGSNKYIIDDYIELRYTKVQNDIGTAVVRVDIDHAAVAGLSLDDEIEIWRGNVHPLWNFTPYAEWRGFYRGKTTRRLTDGSEVADLFFQHEMSLLQRPINAFKAGQDALSTWSSTTIDEIMSDLVDNNFNSTSTDRIYNASSKTVTPDTVTNYASSIDYSAAYRNLLTALQELADYEDIVFEVTKTSSATVSAFTFYTDATTIGTDRQSSVFFGANKENITEAQLEQRQTANTLIIAAGQGEGTDRATATYTTGDFNAGTNQIEQYLDARHLATSDLLTDYATSIGEQGVYRPSLRFQPLQLPDLAYGNHYFWGDIVTVRFDGTDYVQRISDVTITVDANNEEIQIGTVDID